MYGISTCPGGVLRAPRSAIANRIDGLIGRCRGEPRLASELGRKVVLERELQLESVGTETVREIRPSSPLQLGADHRIRHRRVEQVAERVLAGLERGGRLSVCVVDVLAG